MNADFNVARGADNSEGQFGAASQTDIASTFALHEELIGELQRAVVELAELHDRRNYHAGWTDQAMTAEIIPPILDRLATLEARALEQEQALRHILTMLIEWIEGGGQRVAA